MSKFLLMFLFVGKKELLHLIHKRFYSLNNLLIWTGAHCWEDLSCLGLHYCANRGIWGDNGTNQQSMTTVG